MTLTQRKKIRELIEIELSIADQSKMVSRHQAIDRIVDGIEEILPPMEVANIAEQRAARI